jgi:TldD protein
LYSHFSQFGVDEDLVQQVLARALERGGTRAELFFQHMVRTALFLVDGAVSRASTAVDLGAGVRVVDGDQVGYACSEDLGLESLLAAARVASVVARGDRAWPGPPFGVPSLREYYVALRGWEDVSLARRLPILARLDRVARAADPRVRQVSADLEDHAAWILVADSEGRRAADYQPMTACAITCLAESRGRREEGSYRLGRRTGPELYDEATVERVARLAAERTLTQFEAVRPPAGEMPVVLAAGSSGILLHEAIGHGMEADYNRRNVSIYADRMGKRIARDFVSIVDDGTVPSGRGSVNVDDEGEPGQRTLLVDNGVLRSFLHDRMSAVHYRVRPTGNGRRESFRHPPLPRMRNTYMLPGPHTREEILASVKRGLYAETFSNGEVQIGAGDFTFYVKTGFLIEDGRLTRPVKDVNLIGNGPRVLEQVDMVGDDLTLDEGRWTCGKEGQRVPVGLGLPTVRVASIVVGGVD